MSYGNQYNNNAGGAPGKTFDATALVTNMMSQSTNNNSSSYNNYNQGGNSGYGGYQNRP